MAYSPAEVAELVGLSRKAIYRAIDRGELRASRVTNRLRIRSVDVDAWLEDGRVEVRPNNSPPVLLGAVHRNGTPSLRAILDGIGAGDGARSSASDLLPS